MFLAQVGDGVTVLPRVVKFNFETRVHHGFNFLPLLMEILRKLLRDVTLLLLLGYVLHAHLSLKGLLSCGPILVLPLSHLKFQLFKECLNRLGRILSQVLALKSLSHGLLHSFSDFRLGLRGFQMCVLGRAREGLSWRGSQQG